MPTLNHGHPFLRGVNSRALLGATPSEVNGAVKTWNRENFFHRVQQVIKAKVVNTEQYGTETLSVGSLSSLLIPSSRFAGRFGYWRDFAVSTLFQLV